MYTSDPQEQLALTDYYSAFDDMPPLMAMRHLTVEQRIAKMREAMALGVPLTTYDFIPKGAVT